MGKNTYTAVIAIILCLCSPLIAQQKNCTDKFQNEITRSLMTLKEEISPVEVKNEICSNKNLKNVSIFDEVNKPNKRQYKATRDVLCKKSKKHGTYTKIQRKLSYLLDKEQKDSIKACVKAQKKGIKVTSKQNGDKDHFLLIDADLTKRKASVQGIEISPEGSFDCTGTLVDQDILPLARKDLYAACNRLKDQSDDGARIRLKTSAGDIDYEFPPYTPYESFGYEDLIPEQDVLLEPLPSIQGCEVHSLADRSLICSTSNARILCTHHIIQGQVADCLMDYPATPLRSRHVINVFYQEGSYLKELSGNLIAGAFQGNRNQGWTSGSVSYRVNFDTPVREPRPRRQCDPSCPGCDDDICDRFCINAHKLLELYEYGGIAHYFGVDSCESDVEGEIELDEVWKHKAYNLCELHNAWGDTVQGVRRARVSKLWMLNDLRTTHRREETATGFTDEWRFRNNGEYFRSYTDLEIPVEVYCNAN